MPAKKRLITGTPQQGTREEAIHALLDATSRALAATTYGSLYSNFYLDLDGRENELAVKGYSDLKADFWFIEEFFLNYAHGDRFSGLTWKDAYEALVNITGKLADEVKRAPLDFEPLIKSL